MSKEGVRSVEILQLVVLAVLVAWALAVASSVIRHHLPLIQSGPPSGSYVAASAVAAPDSVKNGLSSWVRELATDIRIGG